MVTSEESTSTLDFTFARRNLAVFIESATTESQSKSSTTSSTTDNTPLGSRSSSSSSFFYSSSLPPHASQTSQHHRNQCVSCKIGESLQTLNWSKLGANYVTALFFILGFGAGTLKSLKLPYDRYTKYAGTAGAGYPSSVILIISNALEAALETHRNARIRMLRGVRKRMVKDVGNDETERDDERSKLIEGDDAVDEFVKNELFFVIEWCAVTGAVDIAKTLLERHLLRLNQPHSPPRNGIELPMSRQDWVTSNPNGNIQWSPTSSAQASPTHTTVVNKSKDLTLSTDLVNLIVFHNRHVLFKFLIDVNLVNPAAENNLAIAMSSQWGHIDLVKMLLSTNRVDPSTDNNFAIRNASAHGHVEVVKILLETGMVDPTADRNFAIRRAAAIGSVEIVNMLLKFPQVDPSDVDNYALRFACAKGHTEVVRILLESERIPRGDDFNDAFRHARYAGHAEIVALITAFLSEE
ncbi:hypothetical protein HDU76_009644 [Blyttiomyces sp. JEL0837]|nr:hypothetical protein HDU76_009644 [Blyttiomyces sp. JEL0837]